jgi:hypothetical protein
VILIDGLGQSAREEQWTKPLSRSDYEVNENFAFVRGVYEKGFNGVKNKDASKFSGRADHTRTMLFVPELGWVITDTIETDRPRDIEVLWHFHPDCTVEVDGEKVYTNDKGKGNLMIMPAGDRELAVDIVKGTEEPVQGWYSPRIGEKAANSTAVYRDKIRSKTTYVWLLLPDKNGVPVPAKIEECESGPENDTVRISVEAEKGRLNALIPIGKGLPRVSFLRK